MGVGVDVGVGDGGLFLSLNLLIKIWYKVHVSMYMYTKGIVAQQKSYGSFCAKAFNGTRWGHQ